MKKLFLIFTLVLVSSLVFAGEIYDEKFQGVDLTVEQETNEFKILVDTAGTKYLEVILKDESSKYGAGFFSTESGQLVIMNGSNEELTYIMTVRAEKVARENLLKK